MMRLKDASIRSASLSTRCGNDRDAHVGTNAGGQDRGAGNQPAPAMRVASSLALWSTISLRAACMRASMFFCARFRCFSVWNCREIMPDGRTVGLE